MAKLTAYITEQMEFIVMNYCLIRTLIRIIKPKKSFCIDVSTIRKRFIENVLF